MSELLDGPAVCALLNCTRRQLHAWHSRRRTSGFPEEKAMKTGESASRVGNVPRSFRLWDKDEILEWQRTYVPKRGGAGAHGPNCNCPSHRLVNA